MTMWVRHVAYQKWNHPFMDPQQTMETIFSKIAKESSAQIKRVLSSVPPEAKLEEVDHYLCSTIIHNCFSSGHISWKNVQHLFKKELNVGIPNVFVNAYECASWGYAIRYALKKNPQTRFFLISILDVNVYNFEFWIFNSHWEHSGFGCTTLLLERDDASEQQLITGFAKGKNPVTDFLSAIKKTVAQRAHCTLALPFFPEHIRVLFDQILKQTPRLPDLHAQWGHCFGSDPWLSLLASYEGHKPDTILACSLALNGYYCLLECRCHPDVTWTLQVPQESKGA